MSQDCSLGPRRAWAMPGVTLRTSCFCPASPPKPQGACSRAPGLSLGHHCSSHPLWAMLPGIYEQAGPLPRWQAPRGGFVTPALCPGKKVKFPEVGQPAPARRQASQRHTSPSEVLSVARREAVTPACPGRSASGQRRHGRGEGPRREVGCAFKALSFSCCHRHKALLRGWRK